AILVSGALIILVKVLAKRAHVHEKDGGLHAAVVLAGDDRLFDGVHAAYGGAVRVATLLVARAHALQKGDAMRHLAIRGTLHVPRTRTRSGEQALELDAGDHVGVTAVAQLVLAPGIE